MATILKTLEKNNHIEGEKGVRIVVSGGISSTNIIPDSEPSLLIMIEAPPLAPIQYYTEGAKLITVDMGRLFPTAKTTNYISAIVAQKKQKKKELLRPFI